MRIIKTEKMREKREDDNSKILEVANQMNACDSTHQKSLVYTALIFKSQWNRELEMKNEVNQRLSKIYLKNTSRGTAPLI